MNSEFIKATPFEKEKASSALAALKKGVPVDKCRLLETYFKCKKIKRSFMENMVFIFDAFASLSNVPWSDEDLKYLVKRQIYIKSSLKKAKSTLETNKINRFLVSCAVWDSETIKDVFQNICETREDLTSFLNVDVIEPVLVCEFSHSGKPKIDSLLNLLLKKDNDDKKIKKFLNSTCI